MSPSTCCQSARTRPARIGRQLCEMERTEGRTVCIHDVTEGRTVCIHDVYEGRMVCIHDVPYV